MTSRMWSKMTKVMNSLVTNNKINPNYLSNRFKSTQKSSLAKKKTKDSGDRVLQMTGLSALCSLSVGLYLTGDPLGGIGKKFMRSSHASTHLRPVCHQLCGCNHLRVNSSLLIQHIWSECLSDKEEDIH